MPRRYTVTRRPVLIDEIAPQCEIAINPAREVIEADYFKIEGGALIFRCYPDRNSDGYPRTVHVFAPGVWGEVEEEL